MKKIILVIFMALAFVGTSLAIDFTITPVAQTQGLPKFQTSGEYMVWESDDEIFYYDGNDITQVTNNSIEDSLNDDGHGNIYGPYIVWRCYYNYMYQIFFYDGNDITQVTDSPYPSYKPSVQRTPDDKGIVTWFEYLGSGAYTVYQGEFEMTGPIIADLNGDGYVDFLDFALFAEFWATGLAE